MIYVVDAMMGTGKTSAAIQYMNDHSKDRRFLYITPYLKEMERIRDACPDLKFACPTNRNKNSEFNKSSDLIRLLRQHRNVATTHELYLRSGLETMEELALGNYTVIIDEIVDVFREPDCCSADIQIAVDAGYLVPDAEHSGERFTFYVRSDKEYMAGEDSRRGVFSGLFKNAEMRRLVGANDAPVNQRYICWMLDRKLFTASVDTYVLTYLFDGSPMYAYFQYNHLHYISIGVTKMSDGIYQFSNKRSVPEMAKHIREYINVVDHKKLNAVGEKETALSKSWYDRQHKPREKPTDDAEENETADTTPAKTSGKEDGLDRLRKNMVNYFRNISGSSSDSRLWCTFKGYSGRIRDKGFYSSNVAWNLKATNEYANRTDLAFLVNVYMQKTMSDFFKSSGMHIDQDQYALSCLVQWVWRSAIRNGGKIQLYLPSKRMRRILDAWMDDLENGGDGSGHVVEAAS